MITYKGLPLFGKDSSPHNTSKFLGFIGTCFLWLIILFCMIFIRPGKNPPKYKEVQIVLESRTVEKIEEKKIENPKAVEAVSKSSKKENIVKEEKTEVKTQEKQTSTPKKTVVEESWDQWDDFEYAVDPMEAFAQQTSSVTQKEVDWDAMFGEETSSDVNNNSSEKVWGENSFSGTAGIVSKSDNKGAKSTVVEEDFANNMASGATSQSLGEIKNTKFVSTSSEGISSESNVKVTKSGTGKVYIEMTNGRARALLKPSSPVINLSDEASSLIDGSRNVTIRFMVMKKGTVPSSKITITPGALLPELVQKEIREQISQWIFESDNYDAFAEFEYNIVKK